MGCTNTKLKKAKVFNLHTKEHRTVTSSGLQTQFDSVTNFQIFEKAPVEHEKYTLLRTSNTYPPELIQELQEPQPEKFQQKSYANNPVILLPPKEAEVPDFSFKLSHSQSMEGQNNPVVNTDSVLQNNLDVNHIQRTNTRNPTGTFPGLSNFALENRSLANSNVFNEVQHNIEPNVAQHNEDINHTHKGLSGLAFSFVNPQLSHVHQPTIFYTGNGELGSSNVANSSIFGSKNNEEGKVLETIREGQGGSLGMLDEEQEKGKASAESYPIAGGSTNIYSRESVTSLTNICPGENKKAMLTRKFTSNLIEVVKKDSESSRDELPKLKKKDTITSLNSLDMEDSQKKELSRKFTTNLIHLVKPVNPMKLTSTKSMIVPVKEEVPSVNSLCFNPKSKALSTPNFNLNFKYFPDPVPIPTILEPEKPKIDLDISEIKEERVQEKSMDFSAFDISRDSDRTPPYKQNHLQVITKKAPNSPFLACLNSSYQGQLDTSAMFDKSRLALDNNISRIDLDKYSINVEVCDEKDIQDNNILSPKAPANPSPGRKHLNIGHTRKSKTEKEIRSAVLDIPTDYDTTTQPKSPNTAREDVMPRTKSYTELNGMGRRLLSTDFGRQMPTDLNKTTPSVIETSRVDKSVDHEGQKKINQYLLIKELGKGGFGKVKLAIHCDHKQQYAVKIANKNKLKRKLFSKSKNAYTQLAKEVAILKKMDHPNIVRLFEVIDDPDHNNLYLVMEYIKKGAVLSKNYWKDEKAKTEEFKLNMEENGHGKENRLTEEKAKKYFRHLVLALDYLHNTIGIIHRDIKPENLLIGADDTLKVSDFGISEIMEDGNDLLQTNAGTKSYLAPEAWKDYKFNGKPADIWAAGGTLYYFLFGKPPFQSFNGAEDLKKKILEDEVKFPEEIELSPGVVNLIQACLVKDPRNRITLEEIMVDPWLTDNGANPLEHNLSSEFGPSEDDVEKAFTKISFMAVVYVTATLKKAHKAKEKVKSKKSQEFLQP